MPNLFTSLGFDVHQDEDIENLAYAASRQGEPLAAPSGYYFYYRVDQYIEVWAQANPTGNIIGCVPHYTGDSRITLAVGDLIRRSERPLEGCVYGWVNPTGARFDQGDYPLIVQIPDFDIFRARVSPHTAVTLQVTSFANDLSIFPDDAAFHAAQDDRMKLAPESFVPSGMFADSGNLGDVRAPHAVFSGHIRSVNVRRNGLTGKQYFHSLVTTYGGAYDVVMDPEIVDAELHEGGVIRGAFWLTGRLVS